MQPTHFRFLSVAMAATVVLTGCTSRAPAAHASTAPTQPAPSTRPSTAPATDAAEYIEYRSQPELGVITISNGSVRGERSIKRLTERADDLAKAGIFACNDEAKRRVHRQSEAMGGHKIDTLVVIEPPTGEGEAGDYWAQRVVVLIDGRRKVDCTIGRSADGELWVSQITLFPEDGTIEVRALSADGEEIGLPDEWLRFDDPTVLTDDSFFEDPQPEGKGPPMKV